jgi:transcriptional regulator
MRIPHTDRILLNDNKIRVLEYRYHGKSWEWIAAHMGRSPEMCQYWGRDGLARIERARNGEHRLTTY